MIRAGRETFSMRTAIRAALAGAALTLTTALPIRAQTSYDYRVLATSKTSTMEKELNDAAEAGFRFSFVMGGETAVGGSEGVAVLTRTGGGQVLGTSSSPPRRPRRCRRNSRRRRTRASSIAGRRCSNPRSADWRWSASWNATRTPRRTSTRYKLVATTKTSTLEKELREVGAAGYEVMGMTVSKTALGGKELVAITRKPR